MFCLSYMGYCDCVIIAVGVGFSNFDILRHRATFLISDSVSYKWSLLGPSKWTPKNSWSMMNMSLLELFINGTALLSNITTSTH